MNNTLTTPNSTPTATEKTEVKAIQPILVWDFPTRIFHWTFAICFAGAIITQDMESLRIVHNTCGYTMLGLVAFRMIWGLIGTKHARFASFVPSPKRVFAYIKGLLTKKPIHTVGHNPLGALDVLLILSLVIGVATSGIMLDGGFAEELFEEVHEFLANLLLLVIGVHVLGVLFSSFTHKENLIKSMISGYKLGDASEGIRRTFWWLGLAMILGVGYFWAIQLRLITI